MEELFLILSAAMSEQEIVEQIEAACEEYKYSSEKSPTRIIMLGQMLTINSRTNKSSNPLEAALEISREFKELKNAENLLKPPVG
jgi:hypothetical protein